MDPSLERFLEKLIAFGRAHDTRLEDRRERLRNVEPEAARMLALLLRTTRARRVLEIGTSNGYSTLWLADAARDMDGKVTTVELDVGRAGMACENFAHAGLSERIELRCEHAARLLRESPDDTWDFVFLDAERSEYVGYWSDLLRTLRPLGLLAVDNVLSHADEVADFRALVEGSEGTVSALIPRPCPPRLVMSRISSCAIAPQSIGVAGRTLSRYRIRVIHAARLGCLPTRA